MPPQSKRSRSNQQSRPTLSIPTICRELPPHENRDPRSNPGILLAEKNSAFFLRLGPRSLRKGQQVRLHSVAARVLGVCAVSRLLAVRRVRSWRSLHILLDFVFCLGHRGSRADAFVPLRTVMGKQIRGQRKGHGSVFTCLDRKGGQAPHP